jgi:AcrR family transcriptional regulator
VAALVAASRFRFIDEKVWSWAPKQSVPHSTRELVVTAALDIVDCDGLEGLTMRALGRELGVDAMAACSHVPSKDAILDGVVEAVWAELELPTPSDDSWQSQFTNVARAIRTTLSRHPTPSPSWPPAST